MTREIYYTSNSTYIPISGGRFTFTLIGILRNGEVSTRLPFTKIYSEKDNFTVLSTTQTGEFSTEVVIDVKSLDSIVWEDEKDVINQQLRVSYNFVKDNDEIVYGNFTIPFTGEYDYYLNNIEQTSIGTAQNGTAKIVLCSYATLTTNINNKYLVTPNIVSSLPVYVSITLKTTDKDPIVGIPKFEFSLSVDGNIADCEGVTFNSEENSYILPVTIRQIAFKDNPRNAEFDMAKAIETTFNVKFNNI